MAVEELYSSLNKLLDDICKFLADETNYKNLSLSARKQADELINRSKHQLQKIAKVTIQNNECDGAYVNMEKKSVDNSDDDNDNIYSSVNEVTLVNSSVTIQPQNPYANLPAKEMSQDVKFGSLFWKCRIILRFEKMRRIYAGIHNNWLLIYSSDKDCKPLQTFNLQYHKAQNVPSKSGKNNQSQDFELISTVGEGKTYFFTALTYKDMMQWTTHINNCSGLDNKSTNLLSVSEEDISETYDMIDYLKPKADSDDDEEQIYHDIEILSPNHEAEDINRPPELPLRRSPKSPLPVPPHPTEKNKKDLLKKDVGDSFESNSSFSEDDEDAIYESFTSNLIDQNNAVHVIENRIPKIEESKNISRTNSLEERKKPVTPVKPKFLKGTLRPPVILKK